MPSPYREWRLTAAVSQLEAAGMEVIDRREELVDGMFQDIGAVALYLRIAPWELPDFSFEDYDARLRRLHRRIVADGPLRVRHHRFTITARRPERTR